MAVSFKIKTCVMNYEDDMEDCRVLNYEMTIDNVTKITEYIRKCIIEYIYFLSSIDTYVALEKSLLCVNHNNNCYDVSILVEPITNTLKREDIINVLNSNGIKEKLCLSHRVSAEGISGGMYVAFL